MSPNFIISGVARCGTTSLFHYLNQHPEIGMSNVKEPKYFSSLDLIFMKLKLRQKCKTKTFYISC